MNKTCGTVRSAVSTGKPSRQWNFIKSLESWSSLLRGSSGKRADSRCSVTTSVISMTVRKWTHMSTSHSQALICLATSNQSPKKPKTPSSMIALQSPTITVGPEEATIPHMPSTRLTTSGSNTTTATARTLAQIWLKLKELSLHHQRTVSSIGDVTILTSQGSTLHRFLSNQILASWRK